MSLHNSFTRRIRWLETLSLLNLLALILLYLNIFYGKNALLSQDCSIAKVGKTEVGKTAVGKTARLLSEVKTKFLACITPEKVPETNRKWGAQFKEQLYECLNQHIPIKKYDMDNLKAINVEYKHFLPMDKAYYADQSKDCIWLTAGIGKNTQAEREFLKLYPKCKFFGIELVPENVADFGTFGKVINAGIGFDGLPVPNNLKMKNFVKILDQDVGRRFMHYASIDIDGWEFPMLKEFGDSGQYSLNGVVICQMDIEWHAEIKDVVRDDFEFGTYMRKLFQDASSYLPIFAEPYHPGHPWAIKMTMINIKNTECELAFRYSKYFER
ncbi:hypothetical protein Ddc_10827 [Ditylenchus destructor]|nr:hypothetical protein Ddc_10827 [Ditylenchus destructor]